MSGEKIAADVENSTRLNTFIKYAGLEICEDILFHREHLPKKGAQLYQALLVKSVEFQRLKNSQKGKKPVLSKQQYDLIFPQNGVTDISKFDITLYACVIQEMFKQKYQKEIEEVRKWRNEISHQGQKPMSDNDFNQKWASFMQFVASCGINTGKYVNLKTCALDKLSQLNSRYVPYYQLVKTMGLFNPLTADVGICRN